MKCQCGGKTSVTTTEQREDRVFRRRKCVVCKTNFATLETRISRVTEPTAKPPPKPDERGIYTEQSAAQVKKLKVETRRKIEDRKQRVPSYFIEDEDY